MPLRVEAQILRVAWAYEALPYPVFQQVRAALAGEQSIAQALATARDIVDVLAPEDLALVLARLLLCSSEVLD